MEYQELTYQQMLRVLEDGKVCHAAVVLNGLPYLLPMCYSWRLDGCAPVVELRAYHDGDLLQALAQAPQIILHFSRRVRAGVESVLLRGNACVQLPPPPCAGRCPQGPWTSEGRVRFDMPEGSCNNSSNGSCNNSCNCDNGCSCSLNGSCGNHCNGGCNGSCSNSCSCDSCTRRNCDCPQAQYARITVTAVEMTGRCVPACLAGCKQE